MDYGQELKAKLDAARPIITKKEPTAMDTATAESKVLSELSAEFELGQYDLDESDILRSMKIFDLLNHYPKVFQYKDSLKLFYTLSRVGAILPKNFHNFSQLPADEFKAILNAMGRHNLVSKNESGELELTAEGRSLAERIGVEMYI